MTKRNGNGDVTRYGHKTVTPPSPTRPYNPSFLPTLTRNWRGWLPRQDDPDTMRPLKRGLLENLHAEGVRVRAIWHQATPDLRHALCGAPVLGVLSHHASLECVVCAELLEGRKDLQNG